MLPTWSPPPRGAQDPGGPCPHCPPDDPAATAAHVANIAKLVALADKDTAAGLAKLATLRLVPECVHCKGKGFVRVCRKCDGHGGRKEYVEDLAFDGFDEVQRVIEGPRPVAILDKVVRHRTVIVERLVSQCANCGGSGLEGIDASEVGK